MSPILDGALKKNTHGKKEERTKIHGKPRAPTAMASRTHNAHETEGKKARYVKKQKSTAAPNTPSRPRCLAISRSQSNRAYWLMTIPLDAKIQTPRLAPATQAQAPGKMCRPAAEVSMATGAPNASA